MPLPYKFGCTSMVKVVLQVKSFPKMSFSCGRHYGNFDSLYFWTEGVGILKFENRKPPSFEGQTFILGHFQTSKYLQSTLFLLCIPTMAFYMIQVLENCHSLHTWRDTMLKSILVLTRYVNVTKLTFQANVLDFIPICFVWS